MLPVPVTLPPRRLGRHRRTAAIPRLLCEAEWNAASTESESGAWTRNAGGRSPPDVRGNSLGYFLAAQEQGSRNPGAGVTRLGKRPRLPAGPIISTTAPLRRQRSRQNEGCREELKDHVSLICLRDYMIRQWPGSAQARGTDAQQPRPKPVIRPACAGRSRPRVRGGGDHRSVGHLQKCRRRSLIGVKVLAPWRCSPLPAHSQT